VCRLFALRASQPISARESLVTSANSLERQSRRDNLGRGHADGWGISYYADGRPRLVRSIRAASADRRYRELAESVRTTTLFAHVRQASVGAVAERNSHPFRHGRWTFAHNGTLVGFAAGARRLWGSIPAPLRGRIRGETDSESTFYFVLGHLERAAGIGRGPADVATLAGVTGEAVRMLFEQFPGTEAEPSRLNFVLTDGTVLVASAWGHTLFWCERPPSPHPPEAVSGTPPERVVMVASEPTSSEGSWRRVPDRSILQIDGELRCRLTPLAT
jgi:predicted glutamine amidotransferase